MKAPHSKDAVVIGSGPNGLTSAILLQRAGRRVVVYEGANEIGGGARTCELTLPGFLHDVCSAVHPLAAGSPCFERLPLQQFGLEWVHPAAPLAHPFDDGSAVLLERDMEATCAGLGLDGPAWRALMEPFVEVWPDLREGILAPLRLTKHQLPMARFGIKALRSAGALACGCFQGSRARALFAGMAAHSFLPLEERPSAAFGLVLGITAHAVGWPVARGGSGRIAHALAGYFRSLGGEIRTNSPVTVLPAAPVVMCDVTPRQFLTLAGDYLPSGYRRSLARYRYGPGAFKLDWALDGPIPWRTQECLRAGTVHLGGTLEEIAAWESSFKGRPFIILTQPSLFDSSRAPEGRHTAWAYCHVPNGSAEDMTEAIEAQIERFAPGFRSRALARHAMSPADLERHNPNLVGGDINGGRMGLRQLFTRPTHRLYGTPLKGVYLCSSSTPPGGGVHGMCGYFAARAALGAEPMT